MTLLPPSSDMMCLLGRSTLAPLLGILRILRILRIDLINHQLEVCSHQVFKLHNTLLLSWSRLLLRSTFLNHLLLFCLLLLLFKIVTEAWKNMGQTCCSSFELVSCLCLGCVAAFRSSCKEKEKHNSTSSVALTSATQRKKM